MKISTATLQSLQYLIKDTFHPLFKQMSTLTKNFKVSYCLDDPMSFKILSWPFSVLILFLTLLTFPFRS